MRYRIVKKILRDGSCEYYIQKRFLLFWFYVEELVYFGYYKRLVFDDAESAYCKINFFVNQDFNEFNKKPIKTEILK